MSDTDTQPPEALDPTPVVVPPHPWADLAPENHLLLRLAPLPADAATGPRPLRFIELGEVERHSPDHSLLVLSLHLPGQLMRKEQNRLEVWADHRSKEVRFGPDDGLRLEPQNRGLGRFLLARGIHWARHQWAHYRVEGGALPNTLAVSEDIRQRRDHVLKAQGFEVTYQDPLQLHAHYGAGRVSELLDDWNKEKVQVIGLLDAANMLQQADHNLHQQEIQIRKLEDRVAELKRDDSGLRFTITCLVVFAVFQAGLLIWIATH
ncbi:hypothetical protein [Metapseudomonas otitidis]|uniref:Uncharacterized protein n=1 Tax=Metapseudomonas otitidis TaxID=319939 RepID=A0A679GLM5_9GAMM|nr:MULTISPECIES: hypothetical protein [Pseudomonas]MCO7554454.1 hypothetical protein [Pseudomonas otitidis]MDL5591083.1 hypothetical protein [Bacillus subtilis]MEE1894629.1 hypothetical protein [Pseudomonas otitidis]BCA29268.1 hypothetical protein PtoMrB4_32450 [Pseudomonas otitidis]